MSVGERFETLADHHLKEVNSKEIRIYESPLFEPLTGDTLRPGGFSLTRRSIEFCDFPYGARLLDIGCGRGATVNYLTSEFGFRCTGVDNSSALIGEALKRNPELDLIKANAEILPFPANTFEGVLTECSFSLMKNKTAVTREVKRVLKSGGYWIIQDMYLRAESKAVPGNTALRSCIFSAFNLDTLEGLLDTHGFKIVLFEDHTKTLKETIANIILGYGSLERFWETLVGQKYRCDRITAETGGMRLGYFFMIGRKQ
jgi:ubiquinone/menaquinone biosynthesis C-methylase UbiE